MSCATVELALGECSVGTFGKYCGAGRWCSRWCLAAKGLGIAEVDLHVGGHAEVACAPPSPCRDPRSTTGSSSSRAASATCLIDAVTTSRCPYLRTFTSITKRDWRSTSVAMWLLFEPADQVAFPMSGHGAIFDAGGPFADRDRIDDLATADPGVACLRAA